MKRFVMMLFASVMILSLAACTPTREKQQTGVIKETQGAMTANDKIPDQTAPDLIIVSIYQIGDDGRSLRGTMDAVEELDEDVLIDLLEYYDVLPGWVWVMEYDPGEEAEQPAGPGADSGEPTYTGAILNLNCFTEDLEDEMVRKAVALTYMVNMNADSITLQIDGDDIASYNIDELQ